MEIKKIGNPISKSIMLLHGNLMSSKQFEDITPLLEKQYLIYAVSFDGFDNSGETTYDSAQNQAKKLESYIKDNCASHIDMLFAESLGCGVAILLNSFGEIEIDHMILSAPEYLDYGFLNPLILKIMPKKQYQMAREKKLPNWVLRFMGQSSEGMKKTLSRVADNISLESITATWKAGLYLYRVNYPVQKDKKVSCWYGQKEGHMKKAIKRLNEIYPLLEVKCFEGFGHGEIIDHPNLLVKELVSFMER